MLLSILIPSIPERQNKLIKLLNNLYYQALTLYKNHSSLGLVEILVDDSIKYLDGGFSIGEKRDALLQKSAGEYICYLDDDEDISPSYIEQLVRMCLSGKDVITFRCLIKNDTYWGIANMSINNIENEEMHPNGIVSRTPWHICPVSSEIAKSEHFNKLNHNEDWDWMKRVLSKVTTEEHTDMILTQYNHSEAGSEADRIIRGDDIPTINNSSVLISLAIDGREQYSKKSIRLEESIAMVWKGDVRLYKSYPEYCTPHNVIPYKFKFDLIKKARQDGYARVFWLDSSMRLIEGKDINDLIGEEGIMAFENIGHPLYKYISDKAVENLKVTEDELMSIKQTWGGALGFDFNKDKACTVFEEICTHTIDGSFENNGSSRDGFIAHRHDQAVISVILWKHDVPLLPYGVIAAKNHVTEPSYIQYAD